MSNTAKMSAVNTCSTIGFVANPQRKTQLLHDEFDHKKTAKFGCRTCRLMFCEILLRRKGALTLLVIRTEQLIRRPRLLPLRPHPRRLRRRHRS